VAVASLVLGILGIIFCWFPASVAGVPLALIGLVLAIVARKHASSQQLPTGMATAGLALSIIGMTLSLASLWACIACTRLVNQRAQQMANDHQGQGHEQQQNDEFNQAWSKMLEEKNKQAQPAVPPSTKTAPPPGKTTAEPPSAPQPR
jgi:hypothetical protein